LKIATALMFADFTLLELNSFFGAKMTLHEHIKRIDRRLNVTTLAKFCGLARSTLNRRFARSPESISELVADWQESVK